MYKTLPMPLWEVDSTHDMSSQLQFGFIQAQAMAHFPAFAML